MRRNALVIAAAALAFGPLAAAPAFAATTPPDNCAKAAAAADQADTAYKAALADYQKQVADGGHPGKAEEDNVAALKAAYDKAAANIVTVCDSPKGAMKTGAGSTSESGNTAELAAGAALLGVAGIGGTVLVRRRANGRA
ncbi:hypothetical protein HUT16_14910 [Kitasatospora sp. NA04385]|uniref:hypothetical protein n=1 Tax=Kitasatospora sp. NA04385 TaxID=2742135 RepID=UPI00159135A8|nr:hypothetical protein [Kitasatospora sp. NA04385]QKW20184.1 hypothetical protein HUT16_14910 [Kitasatospora sp. NA04385]